MIFITGNSDELCLYLYLLWTFVVVNFLCAWIMLGIYNRLVFFPLYSTLDVVCVFNQMLKNAFSTRVEPKDKCILSLGIGLLV